MCTFSTTRGRARGFGAVLGLPSANAQAMNLHRGEISGQVAPGAHAMLVFDGAGWNHTHSRRSWVASAEVVDFPALAGVWVRGGHRPGRSRVELRGSHPEPPRNR
jgi:hypothetical protein